jgi:hypothetical protein
MPELTISSQSYYKFGYRASIGGKEKLVPTTETRFTIFSKISGVRGPPPLCAFLAVEGPIELKYFLTSNF